MSYYDKAVEEGRQIVKRGRDMSFRIKGLQRSCLIERVMVVGKHAAHLTGDRATYGERILETYSTDIDLHLNLVREARRAFLVFDGSLDNLGAWIERKVDENGGVTWADVRRKIKRKIDSPEERIQLVMDEVERAGQRLERKRGELQEAISTTGDTEILEEAVGVLERTAQEISDGLIADYMLSEHMLIGDPKPSTPRSEPYRKFIQRQPCCAHNNTLCLGDEGMSEAAHVEMGGKALKGSDFSMIPLCHEVHRYAHKHGWLLAQEVYDFNVVEQVAKHLHKFLTGRDLRFPSELTMPQYEQAVY